MDLRFRDCRCWCWYDIGGDNSYHNYIINLGTTMRMKLPRCLLRHWCIEVCCHYVKHDCASETAKQKNVTKKVCTLLPPGTMREFMWVWPWWNKHRGMQGWLSQTGECCLVKGQNALRPKMPQWWNQPVKRFMKWKQAEMPILMLRFDNAGDNKRLKLAVIAVTGSWDLNLQQDSLPNTITELTSNSNNWQ